jgi:hypothetical protein
VGRVTVEGVEYMGNRTKYAGKSILEMMEDLAVQTIKESFAPDYVAGVISCIAIMRMPYTWHNWDADDGVAWGDAYNAIEARLTERASHEDR